ncbi:M-phase phosphoprotein 9 [Gouania willdenowi]|uniref:M-phase phosphoprotein 9 n=1 Tax=Gouania willdenowi TaxID=441366 RepID=A0A8C5E2A0_GOUWI|nr:M-phase phosphoprotein 9 [Gouania willdenowi]
MLSDCPPPPGSITMSTDDSVSEDVSSSAALSHCHGNGEADVGKESEISLVSSEGTSAEDGSHASRKIGGGVKNRPDDDTPARRKIRTLCLSTNEAFRRGKNLPFINPSSLETLRALVQEIQSSGETDPEMWKDCESRWLHLFQLVEKQYQEQILAQQEQYQCQIQLIQDEIKALVQLQNRPNSDLAPTLPSKTPPHAHNHRTRPSPSPPGLDSSPNPGQEATLLSSGYGTLSAWGSGPYPDQNLCGSTGRGSSSNQLQEHSEEGSISTQREREESVEGAGGRTDGRTHQRKTHSQQLTSWAQRHKLRPRRIKPGADSSDSTKPATLEDQDQHQTFSSPSSFLLRRSDSLMSEASGLTYWRLNECDLYRPLPDSFDSGAHLLLQEAPFSLTPPPDLRPSLKELYQNRQRDGSALSDPPSPQMFSLDPETNMRQSERTSGFTSPSHFSSPSFVAQPSLSPRVGTPVSPDSVVEGSHSHGHGDTDCISDTSSVSASGHVQRSWVNAPSPREKNRLHHPASEEDPSRTHTSTLRGAPTACLRPAVSPSTERAPTPLEDPVILSLLRQNLREKHSRHVTDLKAYYESEIQTLRDRLQLQELPVELEKSNHVLTQRCKHLEKALSEATQRVQELETVNSSLEKKMAEWPERYAVAGAAVKSLQRRLEENKASGREKDAMLLRLKDRVQQMEEEKERISREMEEREGRRARENNMLQDLLEQFNSLKKEHEAVKNNLMSTENKLVDATDHISELKRFISKLESQVKQMDHENQARTRYTSHSSTQPSGAGLFHHPDLLLSPRKCKAQPDVTLRRSPCSPCGPGEGLSRSRKSAFPQSSQSHVRCASPPESDQQPPPSRREGPSVLTPMMRALIELEETRATESRAPWVSSSRTTVGFVEQRHKESLHQKATPTEGVRGVDGGAVRRSAALLRAQRSWSPEGHRSSSLPPPGQRHAHPVTPTKSKRETLVEPLSTTSSPKRCPTDNYSTAFGHMMPREEHLHHRAEGHERRHSFHSSSGSKKRLQFTSDRDDESLKPLCTSSQPDLLPSCLDQAPPLTNGPQSLAEAERLFDELTQEKLQIEAALSRIPSTGGRVTLQSRLDQVSLEDRLDHVTRELGSLRMTLKRFNVLRSCANT